MDLLSLADILSLFHIPLTSAFLTRGFHLWEFRCLGSGTHRVDECGGGYLYPHVIVKEWFLEL